MSEYRTIYIDRDTIIHISIVVIVLALFAFLLIPVHDTIAVNSFSWTYEMSIEEYKTVKDSGWYVPDGGRVYNSYRKEKETKTVTEYDSNGKAVTKEVKVYDIYYEYEIEKWRFKTNIITVGNDRNPYFKEYNFHRANPDTISIGDERCGNTYQHHYVHGTDNDGNSKQYEIDETRWHELEIGGKIKISHFRFGDNVLSMKYV